LATASPTQKESQQLPAALQRGGPRLLTEDETFFLLSRNGRKFILFKGAEYFHCCKTIFKYRGYLYGLAKRSSECGKTFYHAEGNFFRLTLGERRVFREKIDIERRVKNHDLRLSFYENIVTAAVDQSTSPETLLVGVMGLSSLQVFRLGRIEAGKDNLEVFFGIEFLIGYRGKFKIRCDSHARIWVQIENLLLVLAPDLKILFRHEMKSLKLKEVDGRIFVNNFEAKLAKPGFETETYEFLWPLARVEKIYSKAAVPTSNVLSKSQRRKNRTYF